MLTGTQGKSSDFIGPWTRPTCWSWRVSWAGGGVGCGSLWGQGHSWWRYQGVLIGLGFSGGCHFVTKMWRHPTICRIQCWDASGQTTNRAGAQHHPSSDRLPKIFLSPQPLLNTPLLYTKQKQTHRHRDQTCGCQRGGEEREAWTGNLGLVDANCYI